MMPTTICEQWTIVLPEHRAERPQWPWWERARLESMRRNIQPGDVVFDVGAEEGDLSGLYASWGAQLVLVEPNPKVWPNIRAVWEANAFVLPLAWWVGFAGSIDNWHPVNDDIGELRHGRGGWPECAYGPVIGDHGFRHLAEESDATPTIRLDTLAGMYVPQVITIDVEGSELEVLKGAGWLLLTSKPIVYVSVHPEFMHEMYGAEAPEVVAYMESLGYVGKLLAIDHEHHWLFWHPDGRPVAV